MERVEFPAENDICTKHIIKIKKWLEVKSEQGLKRLFPILIRLHKKIVGQGSKVSPKFMLSVPVNVKSQICINEPWLMEALSMPFTSYLFYINCREYIFEQSRFNQGKVRYAINISLRNFFALTDNYRPELNLCQNQHHLQQKLQSHLTGRVLVYYQG